MRSGDGPGCGLLAALRHSRELTGATPGTLEAFLAVRAARTLAVRMERAQRNAMVLAERVVWTFFGSIWVFVWDGPLLAMQDLL